MQLRVDARLRCCALLLVELQYFQRVSQQGLRVVSEERAEYGPDLWTGQLKF
jgi:hypothetical protein